MKSVKMQLEMYVRKFKPAEIGEGKSGDGKHNVAERRSTPTIKKRVSWNCNIAETVGEDKSAKIHRLEGQVEVIFTNQMFLIHSPLTNPLIEFKSV